jgi:hypothetical protein
VSDADADRLGVLATPFDIACGENHHVAAVIALRKAIAPEARKIAARRRILSRRSDDFEQRAIDRIEHVLEAVGADRGIAIADVEPHDRADLGCNRLEMRRDEADLLQAQEVRHSENASAIGKHRRALLHERRGSFLVVGGLSAARMM